MPVFIDINMAMEKIKKAVIEVCGSCNYACQMCPQSPEYGGREKEFKKNLPLATFKNILDELAEERKAFKCRLLQMALGSLGKRCATL
jgi:MoaA/NifB/PqqE/SkfB family radical SAM enzyme